MASSEGRRSGRQNEACAGDRPLGSQANSRQVAMATRLSGSDWLEGDEQSVSAVALAAALKTEGVDMVCLSSGGLAPQSTRNSTFRGPSALARIRNSTC